MKRLTAIILTATTACLMTFISCRKDNDEVKTTFSGFMTGYTDSQGYITVLNDDMGNRYMVNGRTSHYPPDTLVRLVAVISIDENNTASIEDCVLPFSSKAPVDSSLPDSARVSDPLQIQSIYIGGGFLNLHLAIKVQKEGTTHFLAYSRLDSSDKLKFKLYHNAYGDGLMYTKHAYISIPLSDYDLNKNDTVFLSCKGYQEDYDYKLIYK